MFLGELTISLGVKDNCPWNKRTVQSCNQILDADTDRPLEGDVVRMDTAWQILQTGGSLHLMMHLEDFNSLSSKKL